jgi:TonB family protein
MQIGRNLVTVTILALLTMPAMTFGHAISAPAPHDFNFLALENPTSSDSSGNIPKVSAEKSGTLPTTEGMLLQVKAEPGNVHIFTDETSHVSYRTRIEADSREPGAEEFVQQFRVAARATHLGISLKESLPGQIFHGHFTIGYEIHIPRRYNIEVRTLGGNIELQDTEGRVNLFTAGGTITAGRVGAGKPASDVSRNVAVAAKLETRGGHIAVGDVSGTLQATTSGGHITAGNIGGDAILHTGGGQIRTGRISGVAEIDTGGGNVTVQLDGKILRENGSSRNANKLSNGSQVSTGEGDILVYLPRETIATIDAEIDRNGGHRIVADVSLPLKINNGNSPSRLNTIQFEGDLNGGGAVLRLRASSGNIFLKAAEPRTEWSAASPATWNENTAGFFEPSRFDPIENFDESSGFLAEMRKQIQESWWGAIPVDAEEMQKRLDHSVAPVYPEVARRAGIEGNVILRVFISSDGRVTDSKVLSGPPILARAAADAVQQWQYQALRMNGQPVNVVTTLIVSFRLQ